MYRQVGRNTKLTSHSNGPKISLMH